MLYTYKLNTLHSLGQTKRPSPVIPHRIYLHIPVYIIKNRDGTSDKICKSRGAGGAPISAQSSAH